MSLAVHVKALSKRFDNKQILKKLDLSLKSGDSLVIVGASGSGKSVLLKCILGLLSYEQGHIEIFNDKPEDILDKTGMLFQSGALFDSLTIWENIAFKGLYGNNRKKIAISRDQARKMAINLLKEVGLDVSVADLYPAELSGGMIKRAALARAVSFEPRLVFFDEPTAGLDPLRAAQINVVIRKMISQISATAITITHDMSSATTIGDHVAFLHEGNFVWQGPSSEIHNADHPDLRAFIDPIVKQKMH